MRWNESLYPPGGYEFVDADSIRHVGTSLRDLISKLAAYRTRRGIAPGNPVAEVHGQLCSRFPTRCLNGEPPAADQPLPSGAQSLGTRITAWLRSVWTEMSQSRIEFVDEATVKQRALTCIACPNYSRFPGDCVACSETLNTISFQLRAGRDKFSAPLRCCSHFGTDLRVDTLLKQLANAKAPDNCWKK